MIMAVGLFVGAKATLLHAVKARKSGTQIKGLAAVVRPIITVAYNVMGICVFSVDRSSGQWFMHATWHMQNFDDSGLKRDVVGSNAKNDSMMHVRKDHNCATK